MAAPWRPGCDGPAQMSAAALQRPSRRATPSQRSGRLGGVLGVVGVLLVWQLLAATLLGSAGAVPTPVAVVRLMAADGWSFYGPHVKGTVWEALRGYAWGNLVAIGLTLFVVLVPALERVVTQVALASYCLPVVAVGPILTVVLTGDNPIVALSALSVFFTTLIGALLGIRAADDTSMDLVRACGGGRWQQLRRVQLVAMLPSTIAALKIAAPAALLGAIIGEYLGRVDNGLGLAMVISQQQLEVARTWGVAITAGIVAGMGYALVGVIGRLLTPWDAGTATR